MLKTMYASSIEIDEPYDAVTEILDQIDTSALLANTIGILGCNPEYLVNGTVEALCKELSFDVVGGTTNVSDICGNADGYQLALMVLTSDTLSFSAGVSASLGENAGARIADLVEKTSEKFTKGASIGIFFAPFMLEVSADFQLRSLEKAAENIPLFGTVALDYVDRVRDPRTIYNGKDYTDCMVLLLIEGSVKPEFFIESISEDRFLKQKAIITASTGSLLQEVNNVRAIDYLESIGIAKNGTIKNIPLVPLSVDTGDGGRPVARAIFAVTPDGSVVCGADMPVGATLGIASFDARVVEETAVKLANKITGSERSDFALIFSCIGRNRALGLDLMHEIEKIQSVLGKKIPYFFMCSSGEICPDYVAGKPLNKAHNDSIIACVL